MVHCDGKKCEKWPCEGIIAVSGWSAYVPLRLRLVWALWLNYLHSSMLPSLRRGDFTSGRRSENTLVPNATLLKNEKFLPLMAY